MLYQNVSIAGFGYTLAPNVVTSDDLEKRLGVQMSGCDIYVNAAGGLDIDEPGSDLGIFTAIFSSMRNHSLPSHTVLLGELSLSGEIRPVSHGIPEVHPACR